MYWCNKLIIIVSLLLLKFTGCKFLMSIFCLAYDNVCCYALLTVVLVLYDKFIVLIVDFGSVLACIKHAYEPKTHWLWNEHDNK